MNERQHKKLPSIWRTIIEVGFIIFLFYSNILMGEFTQSGMGQNKGLLWAIQNIFTTSTFTIAVTAGLVGHLFFSYLRKKI
jgi:hypothetical protein